MYDSEGIIVGGLTATILGVTVTGLQFAVISTAVITTAALLYNTWMRLVVNRGK